MTENEIGNKLISTAVDIHKELGPGLLETVYERVLEKELQRQGIKVERQVPVEINYKGIKFRDAFRADLIVENKVIVELKCIERINNSHKKQLLTYLRLTGIKLGYLLNFSEGLMKNGITRTINGFV